MQAVRFVGVGRQPAIEDVKKPSPGPGQVVVRIGGAGVCHSDLHVMHVDFGLTPHAETTEFPLTEAVAVYEKLAAGKIAGRAVLVPGGA